jgi:clusterin-associated protein 1
MTSKRAQELIDKLKHLGFKAQKGSKLNTASFEYSDFKLVADILKFLIASLDSSSDYIKSPGGSYSSFDTIHDHDLSTEQGRVSFIRHVTEALAIKFHIEVNPKRLYQADETAITELLKVINYLYESDREYLNMNSGSKTVSSSLNYGMEALSSQLLREKINSFHQNSNSIIETADKELKHLRSNREESIAALATTEFSAIERQASQQADALKKNLSTLKKTYDSLRSEEKELKLKLEKRTQELEVREQRLKSMRNVRPAFMEEYEKLEAEIMDIYANYVSEHNNYTWLKRRLNAQKEKERKKAEENSAALKQWLLKLEQNEKNMLRSDSFAGMGRSSSNTFSKSTLLDPALLDSTQSLTSLEHVTKRAITRSWSNMQQSQRLSPQPKAGGSPQGPRDADDDNDQDDKTRRRGSSLTKDIAQTSIYNF